MDKCYPFSGATRRKDLYVGFYPSFESLGLERIVEALIETVSVSTRLCYDESPEPLLRQIWKYTGDVMTEGVI